MDCWRPAVCRIADGCEMVFLIHVWVDKVMNRLVFIEEISKSRGYTYMKSVSVKTDKGIPRGEKDLSNDRLLRWTTSINSTYSIFFKSLAKAESLFIHEYNDSSISAYLISVRV